MKRTDASLSVGVPCILAIQGSKFLKQDMATHMLSEKEGMHYKTFFVV